MTTLSPLEALVLEIARDYPQPVRTVGQNLKRIREGQERDQKEVAAAMGVPQSQLSNWENDRYQSIDTKTLFRLAKAYRCSVEELLEGVDDQYDAEKEGRRQAQTVEDIAYDVSSYKKNDIPVIGEGDASPDGVFWDPEGKPLIHVEDWMSRPNDAAVRDPSCYAIVVRGDSMEPLIKRGHRLIISPNIPVSDGEVAYVHLKSGERLVKVVYKTADGWVLESYNRDYPPRFVSRTEVAAIHRVAYHRMLK
jgi:phage repressor protein C with HTH and peptisase S24 domain